MKNLFPVVLVVMHASVEGTKGGLYKPHWLDKRTGHEFGFNMFRHLEKKTPDPKFTVILLLFVSVSLRKFSDV